MSIIDGGVGNDILGGTSNDDLINGFGGDDTLKGAGGNDVLNGGADDDTLKGASGNDTLNGDAGVDQLVGGGGEDILNGGADNDILIGGKGADTLDGGDGDDTYQMVPKDQTTADTFNDTGTGGEDTIDADLVLQLMLSGDFSAASGIESIVGNAEDRLTIVSDGQAVNWDFTGVELENVKQILGSGENDVITGSDGDDKVKGAGGDDELNGGLGDDNLIGGGGDDVMDGGDGDDKLTGGGGVDTLVGGVGNDTLTGGGGNDVMDGGEGNDTYVYIEGESIGDDDLADTGVVGTDVVDVSGATAMLMGDDVDAAAAGIEEIHGNDVTGTKLIAGEGAVDWNFGGVTMEHITQITGSGENDLIAGSDSGDRIKAGGGDDYVAGGAGNDNLLGNGGDDDLFGDEGVDVLKGGGGEDTLAGGAGNDTLKGGGDNDTLSYSAEDGLFDGQDGEDTLSLALFEGTSDATLDLTESAGDTFKNIEVIDLGDGGNTVVLDKASVKLMSETSETLTVNGGATDAVTSAFEWTTTGIAVEGYNVFTSGAVTLKVQVGVDVSLINTAGTDEAPALGVNTGAQVDEGGTITITSDMLSALDVDSAAGDVVFKVTELPSHGSILVDGVALLVNGTFTQADLDGDLVTYVNANDDGVLDGFSFTLSDGGNIDALSGGFSLVINSDITGTGADEVIFGSAGDDTLNGGAGNDTLNGLGGNDTLNGGDHDDVLTGGAGDDAINGGNGIDTADFTGAGTSVILTLVAGAGLATGYGADTLTGIENVTGSVNADTITGDANDNVIIGGDGDDTIVGGIGNDTLIDDAGNDTVSGGEGNDTIFGSAGNDTLSGQGGIDTLDFTNATTGITITLSAGSASPVSDGNDTISGFENITGSTFNDTINGDALDNVIKGGAGNDTVDGSAGDDTLNGGAGTDTLNGGAGNDDTADYSDDTAGVTVNLAVAGPQNTGGAGSDTLSNIENLTGGTGNDTLTGNSGANVLDGGDGIDTLIGGGGNDTQTGGGGNDTLIGGGGNDTLTGGSGEDFFVFNTDAASVSLNESITDFEGAGAVGGDVIQFDNSVFTALTTPGVLSAGEFVSGTSLTLAGLVTSTTRIQYNTETGGLYYDPNGNGSSGDEILITTITGSPDALTFTDIEVFAGA